MEVRGEVIVEGKRREGILDLVPVVDNGTADGDGSTVEITEKWYVDGFKEGSQPGAAVGSNGVADVLDGFDVGQEEFQEW